MSPAGLSHENGEWVRWRGPAAIVNDRPILCERGCYIRIINASVQLENKFTGRESQGACRQDEPICCKPPLWFWLWMLANGSRNLTELSQSPSWISCDCELAVRRLEAGNDVSKENSVRSRYQATTGDIEKREDSVRAQREVECVICECSINPIAIASSVSNH
jgi:hypothetical protein